MSFEPVNKLPNTIQKLETLLVREGDQLVRDVPLESDECCDEFECIVALLFMPRNAQRGDATKHFVSVIVIQIIAVGEGSRW
jgi:hypothetical protein